MLKTKSVSPKPVNPGMSPKTWDKLHKMLAASNIKYSEEIQKGRMKEAKKVG